MALSKSRRMQILLVIDLLFFILELSVGIAVHSLALVADSFHMLNDIISLCVGLWAVNVAKSKPRSNTFTYGWQGAETLGALINGVFLAALCFSIILEAIERFFSVPEVSNPEWILGVGSAGLVSNILGLFLFHDHGHSHGHGHDHSHASHEARDAEEGLSTSVIADESGSIATVLPESQVRFAENTSSPNLSKISKSKSKSKSGHEHPSSSSPHHQHRLSSESHRSRSRTFSNVDDLATHPAYMRSELIAAAENTRKHDDSQDTIVASESTPLLTHSRSPSNTDDLHKSHNHSTPKPNDESHGHSHGDLNMKGVWLHVMGDALGNIGVIATALFIWLTPYTWRFYADPLVSLVIAFIILYSAYPLCVAASRILLMAVPLGINIDDIREDILALPGVAGVHHLHVWQLSDATFVASLHVKVDSKVIGVDQQDKGERGAHYMKLAKSVRTCLHAHGIHSTTIQPEFCSATNAKQHLSDASSTEAGSFSNEDIDPNSSQSTANKDPECLLECGDDCDPAGQCCRPSAPSST